MGHRFVDDTCTSAQASHAHPIGLFVCACTRRWLRMCIGRWPLSLPFSCSPLPTRRRQLIMDCTATSPGPSSALRPRDWLRSPLMDLHRELLPQSRQWWPVEACVSVREGPVNGSRCRPGPAPVPLNQGNRPAADRAHWPAWAEEPAPAPAYHHRPTWAPGVFQS